MVDYDVEWKNHAAESFEFLAKYQREDRFTDVSICCSSGGGCDGVISAHRVVLSACSAYLDRVFERLAPRASFSSSGRSQQTVVLLPDATPDILELAVEFMYTGEASVQVEKFDSFLKLGQLLEIRGLRDAREKLETTGTAPSGGVTAEEAPLREISSQPNEAIPEREGKRPPGRGRKRKSFLETEEVASSESVSALPAVRLPMTTHEALSTSSDSVRPRPKRSARLKNAEKSGAAVKTENPAVDYDSDDVDENFETNCDEDYSELQTGGTSLSSCHDVDDPLGGDANFEFLTTQKGGESLIQNGYIYRLFKVNKDGASVWRCEYRRNGCHTGIKLNKERTRIIVPPPKHSHEPNPDRCQARKLIERMKREVGGPKSLQDIEKYVVSSGVSMEVMAALPSKLALRRCLQRAYKKNAGSSSSSAEPDLTVDSSSCDGSIHGLPS